MNVMWVSIEWYELLVWVSGSRECSRLWDQTQKMLFYVLEQSTPASAALICGLVMFSASDFFSVTNCRFRPVVVKECIHQILSDFFLGKSYVGDECTTWCKDIAHQIKDKLKGEPCLKCCLICYPSLVWSFSYKFVPSVHHYHHRQ